MLALRQVGSVHAPWRTSNLCLPSHAFLPCRVRLTCAFIRMLSFLAVFPRLASVSILSDRVSPYPAGYAFPVPFGRWPSLLKQSRPSYGCVPPLPLAYWRAPDHMGVITFHIGEMRPMEASSLSRRACWCSRSCLDGPTPFGCLLVGQATLLSSTS
jgi:hypothetical protein